MFSWFISVARMKIYVCICENGFNNEEFLICNCSCVLARMNILFTISWRSPEYRIRHVSIIIRGLRFYRRNKRTSDAVFQSLSLRIFIYFRFRVCSLFSRIAFMECTEFVLRTFIWNWNALITSKSFSVGLFYGMYRIRREIW